MIDVQAGTLSFQLYGERVDFCFLPPIPPLKPTILPHPAVPGHTVSPVAVSKIEIFDGDSSSDLTTPCLASLGSVSAHAREVVDTTVAFHDSLSLPSPSLLPIHMR